MCPKDVDGASSVIKILKDLRVHVRQILVLSVLRSLLKISVLKIQALPLLKVLVPVRNVRKTKLDGKTIENTEERLQELSEPEKPNLKELGVEGDKAGIEQKRAKDQASGREQTKRLGSGHHRISMNTRSKSRSVQ